MVNFIQKLFSGVNPQYLFKSYFFSAVLSITFLYISLQSVTPVFMYLYLIFCGFLFPFASIVWDDFISTIMGDHIIMLPLPFMLLWKVVKIFALYFFTPLIAPVGILYIYFANGFHKRT